MSRKEFYLIAVIVIYTYLAIIFQVNLKNFVVDKDLHGENGLTFNAYK